MHFATNWVMLVKEIRPVRIRPIRKRYACSAEGRFLLTADYSASVALGLWERSPKDETLLRACGDG
jgi:hypothetical protein